VKEKKIVHLFFSEFFFWGVRERTPSPLAFTNQPPTFLLLLTRQGFGNRLFLRFKKQPVLLTHGHARVGTLAMSCMVTPRGKARSLLAFTNQAI
jgi:hypothetical protein